MYLVFCRTQIQGQHLCYLFHTDKLLSSTICMFDLHLTIHVLRSPGYLNIRLDSHAQFQAHCCNIPSRHSLYAMHLSCIRNSYINRMLQTKRYPINFTQIYQVISIYIYIYETRLSNSTYQQVRQLQDFLVCYVLLHRSNHPLQDNEISKYFCSQV